jgi:predicted amidophosphoribosyltransferase
MSRAFFRWFGLGQNRVVLTKEEHLNFKHLCGRTGADVEKMGDFCWTTCEILKDCLLNHCVKPADLLPEERFVWSVDRLVEIARGMKK